MFQIENLNAGYGESQVLRDVSFGVAPRESVAVMGRNGMGKTTLLKALIGMLPARSGSIRLEGRELAGLESYQRVRSGLAFVPQGRMIFPFLTVEQNILAGAGERARARCRNICTASFRCSRRCGRARAAICPAASSSSWRSRGR